MALDKLLRTDLSALSQIIRSKGRGKDTVLAHITPKEAALLKARGGRGSINPDTGLPEFDDTGASTITDIGGSVAGGDVQLPSSGASQYALGGPTTAVTNNPDLYPAGSAYVYDAPYSYSTQYNPSGQAERLAVTGPSTTAAAPDVQTGLMGPPVSAAAPDVLANYTGAQTQGGIPTALKTTSASSEMPDLSNYLPSKDTTGRLLLAAGLGAYGAQQAKGAQAEAEQAAAQKQAIATPYQQQGAQLVGAAQRGELTPVNQQVIAAARARMQQASAASGGIGQQQIESNIAGLTSQLLNNQYQYGLQVMQIGDNIALGAINTQLQLDTQLQNANKQFYTSLATMVAGVPSYITPTSATGYQRIS